MEEWKDIEGYEGYYQISSHGRVRSVNRYVRHPSGKQAQKRGRIFRNGWKNKSLIAGLTKEGKSRGFLIYRLVAKAFIPNPDNKPEVNHIDGNRMNNHISNLEWSTRSENEKHAYDTGLYISRKGNEHPMSKLSETDINRMKNLLSEGKSKKDISKVFNVSYSHVCKIFKGTTWKHLPESEYINKATLTNK